MSLGGYGLIDQRRALTRILSPTSNDTSLTVNSFNHSSSSLDFFRYKTSKIFVCIPSRGYERFFRTYIPIFDILLVAVIPFVLLCFTNLGIIFFTMNNNKRMKQHRKRTHRRHQRLTIMLLSVTLAFIGLTCPSVIFICVNKIIYSNQIISGEKDSLSSRSQNVGQPVYIQVLVDICEALWYMKHAMNFILYTLSGQDFRREFLKLFPQCLTQRISFIGKFLNKPQTTTTTPPRTSTLTNERMSHGHIRIIDSQQRLLVRSTISKSSSSPSRLISSDDI